MAFSSPLRQRLLRGAQVVQVTLEQVTQRYLQGGHRVARGGPAEQVPVPFGAYHLALIGQHDRYSVTDPVAAAQPRVVQEVILGEVEQRLLVDRAGQEAQQQWVQTHLYSLSRVARARGAPRC